MLGGISFNDLPDHLWLIVPDHFENVVEGFSLWEIESGCPKKLMRKESKNRI